MKYIQLSKGYNCIVDDEDFEFLNSLSWHTNIKGGIYAVNCKRINKKIKHTKMHRLLLNALPGQLVDHINGNTLDNRKENLRITNYSGNSRNCKKRLTETYSQYKGVSWSNKRQKWQAQICINNKLKWIGYFKFEVEAAKAYDQAAIKYFREFAKLNFNE